MKFSDFYPKTFLAMLLIATMFLSSCVDLQAIRKFAQNSATISEKFPDLATDIYDTCVRKYRYQTYRGVNFDPRLLLKIDELSQLDIEKISQVNLNTIIANPSDDIKKAFGDAQQAETLCRKFKNIVPTTILLNTALSNYMKTMGDLAADDLTSYDEKLKSLGSTVADGNYFNDAQVKAGQGLATLVIGIFTNGYRQKKLKNAIEDGNNDVKILTVSLKQLVKDHYLFALEQEQKALNDYYRANLLNDSTANKASNVNSMIAKTIWDAENQRLKDRITSAQAYVKILDKIADGHQKLYDNRNKLNTDENRKTALQYAQAIDDLIGDFKKAFK